MTSANRTPSRTRVLKRTLLSKCIQKALGTKHEHGR